MNTLVLGAGFLGLEIAKIFLNHPGRLFLSRKSGLPVAVNKQTLTTLQIDVLDPLTFDNIPADITHIVYCVSAQSSDASSYHSAYYEGIRNVISYAKQNLVQDIKFAFVSSTGVFIENKGGIVGENSKLNTEDVKYKSLIDGENLVLSEFGPAALILRLSGIYGEGREYLINLAKKTSDLSGIQIGWSNRIHKSDAALALKHLWTNNLDGVYIVSDNEPCLNIEVINFLRSRLGLSKLDLTTLNKNGEPTGKRCSSNKLQDSGFTFLYPSYREGYSN